MERAFEPGSGEPGVANDAGWPAGAWDDPVHEQPPKGGLSPVTGYDPGTGVRDSAAFRPLSSCCQGSGTLDMAIQYGDTIRWVYAYARAAAARSAEAAL